MKKHKICKILLVILAIFLCVAFYELLGICVAYKKQPEVSNTTKKETKNGSWNECSENTERAVIIEKNPEALLQRVRLIADFPHDNWWKQVTIRFSDGSEVVAELEKSEKPHEIVFEERVITELTLEKLKKADDPSPFPALTQIEVYGREAEEL